MLGAIDDVICDESTVGPPRKSRGHASKAADTSMGCDRVCGQASDVATLTPGRCHRAAAERRGAAVRNAADANQEPVP